MYPEGRINPNATAELLQNWTMPNAYVQSNLEALKNELLDALKYEVHGDRRHWLKEALKNVRAADTAILRANSALNSASFFKD